MNVLSHIVGLLLVVNIIAMVIGWAIKIFFDVKCKTIKNCKKEDCPVRVYCHRTVLGDNEKRRLLEMIKNYSNESGVTAKNAE